MPTAPLDDAALTALLDLAWTHVRAQRAAAFVDPERLVSAVADAATAPRVDALLRRFVDPVRDRALARHRASKTLVAAWLPDATVVELRKLLGAPAPLPRAVVDEFVRSQNVRDGVRTMLSETLSGFVARAFERDPAAAPRGGLRGALSMGARVAGGVATGVLSGIGGEVQRQLEDRVRDFVDGSVGAVLDRIAAGLLSAETARALGQRRRATFDAILRATEADAVKLADGTPWARIDPLRASVVVHNLSRAELRTHLVEEVRATVDALSQTTLGELLDEFGLGHVAAEAFHAHGLPLLRSLAATEAFGAWSERHAHAATP